MANATVFNAVATNPGGTGSTITVTLSTHAVNDLLIIFVGNTGNTLWTGNPTGWSRIDQRTVGASSNGVVGTWLWRKVVSGDTLPLTNPVCTLGATVTRAATCRTVRGADLQDPFILPEYGDRGFGVGTSNPVRPPAITTHFPEGLILHCYAQRAATAAPDPSGYTADAEVVISGTLVVNASSKVEADQNTALSNQDASPTSGARWTSGIICIPSPDYVYYRSGSQALTASGTSATPSLPTGTLSSDWRSNKELLIATVEAAGTPTISPQVGADWTEIGTWATTTSGGGTTVRKYWALYDGSINLQFNRSTTGEIAVCVTGYRNSHQSSPIGNTNTRQNASSTSSAWDALNRSSTRSTMSATCVADSAPAFAAPAGWTERMDGNGIVCADQVFNATGSTASAAFALNSASPTVVGLVEVLSLAGTGDPNLTTAASDSVANLSDSTDKILGYLKTLTDDASNLADVLAQVMDHLLPLTDDANTLADAYVQVKGQLVVFSDDANTLADAYAQELLEVAGGLELGLSDALSLSDQLSLGYGLLTTDSISLDDTQAMEMAHLANLSDQLILSDFTFLNEDHLFDFNDSFILVDSESNILGYNELFTDTISLADDESNELGYLLEVSDQITLADTYAQILHHLFEFSDSVSLTDSAAFLMVYLLGLSEEVNFLADFVQTDTPQGPVIQVGIVDSLVTLNDSVQLNLSHELALDDNAANWADSTALTYGFEANFADNVQPLTDAVSLSSEWLLQFSDSFTFTDALTRFGEEFLSVTDAFLLSDEISLSLEGPSLNLAIDDNFTLSDSASLDVGGAGQLQLTITDVIVLNDHYFDLRHPYTPSTKRHIVVSSRARVTRVPASERTTEVS